MRASLEEGRGTAPAESPARIEGPVPTPPRVGAPRDRASRKVPGPQGMSATWPRGGAAARIGAAPGRTFSASRSVADGATSCRVRPTRPADVFEPRGSIRRARTEQAHRRKVTRQEYERITSRPWLPGLSDPQVKYRLFLTPLPFAGWLALSDRPSENPDVIHPLGLWRPANAQYLVSRVRFVRRHLGHGLVRDGSRDCRAGR